MRDFRDAKLIARTLRDQLKAKNVDMSVAESLELVSKQFGLDNWNVLAAKIDAPAAGDAIVLTEVIPIIRMFDIAKATEFYVGFLGFTEDWRGEVFPGAPLYMQLSRAAVKLHLSEHHGDAAPGGTTVVQMTGIKALHAELIGKNYKYNRPSLQETSYGTTEVHVVDPFGNSIRFTERREK